MKKDKKCLNCSRMTLSQDEYISCMQDKIHDLEKENAELKKDKEWLDNTNNEQTEVILKLQAQIEKMRCCGNCSEPCWNPPIVRKFECLNNNYSLWEIGK